MLDYKSSSEASLAIVGPHKLVGGPESVYQIRTEHAYVLNYAAGPDDFIW